MWMSSNCMSIAAMAHCNLEIFVAFGATPLTYIAGLTTRTIKKHCLNVTFTRLLPTGISVPDFILPLISTINTTTESSMLLAVAVRVTYSMLVSVGILNSLAIGSRFLVARPQNSQVHVPFTICSHGYSQYTRINDIPR